MIISNARHAFVSAEQFRASIQPELTALHRMFWGCAPLSNFVGLLRHTAPLSLPSGDIIA
jgi:hypothetical protein